MISVVLDCADPERLAAFWTEALGYRRHEWPHEPYVVLVGDGPRFLLQRVTEPKSTKNRMHIDVHVPDIEAEAARLEGVGAARVATMSEFGVNWIVMVDPEGNEFCVCEA